MALTDQELKNLAKEAEKRKEVAKLEADAAASITDTAEQAKALEQAYQDQEKQLKKIVQLQEARVAAGVGAAQAEADRAKTQLAALQAQIDANDQILEQEAERAQYQKILKTDSERLVEDFFKIDNKTRDFSKALKQSGGFSNLLKDKMKAAKTEMTKLGGKTLVLNAALQIAKDVTDKMKQSLTKMRDITIDPVKKAVNFENAMEIAVSRLDEFRSTARDLQILKPGGIDNFRKSADALSSTFRGTSKDVREITSELFKTSNQFRELKAANDPAADSLIKTSFLLKRRLNIPIAETAQLTETLALTFGKSSAEAEGFAKSLAVTASEMGLNVSKTFKNFQAQSNNLAKFGIPDLKKEILELSAINQKTGISIDSMVSSLEKFSTFEGALTSASQLNAVFGTTIDGLELMDTVMTEGPVEGFIKLRETLEAAGIQIDKLGFAQMRQLTGSIGLSAEQMKAFGEVSTEELRKITAGAVSGAEAQKMLTEAQGEGELTAEQQEKTQRELVKTLDRVATSLDKITRKTLRLAESFPGLASAAEKFAKPALQLVGMGIGFIAGGPLGAAVGAMLAGSMADMIGFAPGENFVSKPTIARVGEVGNENIMRASQVPQTVESSTGITTVLNPGDSVQRMAAAGNSATTNLTINLVGKEGKVFDSTTQTISESQVDQAVSHYLNSRVSLLNS